MVKGRVGPISFEARPSRSTEGLLVLIVAAVVFMLLWLVTHSEVFLWLGVASFIILVVAAVAPSVRSR